MKPLAITFQCRNVNVVHRVVLQEQTVVAIMVSIAHHHREHFLWAMIVSFVVSNECSSYWIVIDIDWTSIIVGLWYPNGNNRLAVDNNCLDILVSQQIYIHLLWVVDDVPKILADLIRIIHASYRESLTDILLLQVLIHA